MKKIYLFIISVLFSTTLLGQIYVGLKGGYTMSNISFEPVEETKMLFSDGFDYGITVKHFNAKYVGFQAELYTTSRGYRKYTDDTNLYTFMRVNKYIELPMFIQFRINLKVAYLHLNAGPYMAYLISAKEGDNTSGEYVIESVKFNVLRDNRFDYGLMGGVGLSYDFRWGTIQAEARVGYGFADLYDYTYANMPKQSIAVTENVNVAYYYTFGKGLKRENKE